MAIALVSALVPIWPSAIASAAGCDTPGTPTTTVYLPNITKTLGGPSGWVTPFMVQNVGAAAATLEVSFYSFGSGSLVTCRKVTGLAPGTSFADVPNNDTDLPADSQFAVVVRSFGSQVVSVVNQHQGVGQRAEALSYVGLTAGATKIALPYVAKAVGGWITTIVVQNLGAATAAVTASFVNDDGARTATLTRTIGPGRSQFIDPTVEPLLLAGTEYAVSISSTQPIAVVVNAHNDAAAAAWPKGFSYNGIAAAAGDAFLPWAGRNADGTGRFTSIVVQNSGSADATPALRFRRIGGTEQAIVTAPTPLRPGRRWVYLLPSVPTAVCPAVGTPTCPRDGEHSVVVTGGDFAVLGYSLDIATAMAVTAGPPSPARIYVPNVTRTLGGPSGWTTPIILQSAGATSATLRWHRFSDGALAVTQYVPGLLSGGSVRIDPRTVTGLTDDTQYAVVADANGAARAIVLEFSQSGGDGAMAYEGFAATGTLSAAPVPTSLSVAPTTASVALGRTQQFSAVVRDQSGNAITGVPITWSLVPATIGTASENGLFTAGSAAGSGTLAATFGSLSATASLTTFSPTVAIDGVTFNVRATGTADVYTESTISLSDAQKITASVASDVSKVEAEFARSFATRPSIYVFDSVQSAIIGNQSIFKMSAAQAAQVAKMGGFFDPRAPTSVAVNWHVERQFRPITIIRHELVHMIFHQVAGEHTFIPAWFNEGNARLIESTVPGAEWWANINRYTAVSAAAQTPSQLLPLADLVDQGAWNSRTTPTLQFQYYEASSAAQFLRDDVGIAGTMQILELLGKGPSDRSSYVATFNAAFQTVTGKSLESFATVFPERLRASVPSYPGVVTTTETYGGRGLQFVAYGFSRSATVTYTLAGPSTGTFNAQTNEYGVLSRYFTTAFNWIPGSYVVTVIESPGKSATAAATFAPAASEIGTAAEPESSTGLPFGREDPLPHSH